MNKPFTFYFFFLASCILHLAPHFSIAQNLVSNPSFENKSSCPTTLNQVPLALPWVNPSGTSPDYFNQCAFPISGVDVPQNTNGYENAKTDIAYAGMISYLKGSFNFREYIQVQLTDSLITGQQYCVTFYVSLADRSVYAIKSFGAYLSNDSIRIPFGVFPYTPQISNPSTNLLNDTSGWTAISGIITAVGGEKYITIGNFNTDANSDTTTVNPFVLNQTLLRAYYYVDDVSVFSLVEANAGLTSDTTICKGQSIPLGSSAIAGISYNWQPATGLNNNTLAQPIASPTIPTTYILTITDTSGNYCIVQNTDTITINVRDCDSSSFIQLPISNVFTPNNDGVNDVFQISGVNMKEMKCEIYDRWGIKVNDATSSLNSANSFISWDGKTSAGLSCVEGVYYYIVTATGKNDKEYTEKGFVQLIK